MSNPFSDDRRLGLAATADLPPPSPPPGTGRWVARRKAAVVAAVRRRELSPAEACSRYGLSAEELASWERLVDRYGTGGLRVTRLKEFR